MFSINLIEFYFLDIISDNQDIGNDSNNAIQNDHFNLSDYIDTSFPAFDTSFPDFGDLNLSDILLNQSDLVIENALLNTPDGKVNLHEDMDANDSSDHLFDGVNSLGEMVARIYDSEVGQRVNIHILFL